MIVRGTDASNAFAEADPPKSPSMSGLMHSSKNGGEAKTEVKYQMIMCFQSNVPYRITQRIQEHGQLK